MKALIQLYEKVPSTKKAYLQKIKEEFVIRCLPECQNAILFGCANLGVKILDNFRREGINILAFADNDRTKWGTCIENIPIISPENIHGFPYSYIIITSKYVKDIHTQLCDLKIRKVLPHYVLSVLFPHKFPNTLYEGAYNFILNNRSKIEHVYTMLSDRKSKEIYIQIIDFLLSLSPEKLPLAEKNQYFIDEFALSNNETYVDVGAFDGDTLKEFLRRRGIHFNKYFALEPDGESFNKLKNSIREYHNKRIIALRVAASSKNGYVYFSDTGKIDACVLKNGKNRVEAATTDKLFKKEVVTSLKIDVEGYELHVLRGSKEILKQHKPKLAVCVYHRPQHLWEIPLLIKSLNPDYKYFILRHHEEELSETVLYAI
jgi:FkbM family methyltransferase